MSSDFSGPHRRLGERGLVNREDNQYQYRFRDIVDLDSGQAPVHHRARGAKPHPSDVLRPLVNRNPAQTTRNFAAGYEATSWAMGPEHFDDQPQRPM